MGKQPPLKLKSGSCVYLRIYEIPKAIEQEKQRTVITAWPESGLRGMKPGHIKLIFEYVLIKFEVNRNSLDLIEVD